MRKFFTLLSFIAFSAITYAQELSNNVHFIPQADVPRLVLERQQDLFPTNYVSQWQVQEIDALQDGSNIRYIAQFEEDGRPGFSASYLPNGMLVFRSEFFPSEIIPAPIRLKIDETYKDYTIQNAHFITPYSPKREIYLVKLLDGLQMQYVFYDTIGNQIDKNDLPAELLFLMK